MKLFRSLRIWLACLSLVPALAGCVSTVAISPTLSHAVATRSQAMATPNRPTAASPTPTGTPLPATPTLDPGIITPANAARLAELRQLGMGYQASPPLFTPDGRWLLLPTSSGIYRYDTSGYGAPRRILAIPVNAPVSISPDGQTLAVGSRLFDIRGEEGRELPGLNVPPQFTENGPPLLVRFSPDGQTLGLAYYNQQVGLQVGLFARDGGSLRYSLPGKWFDFSPDGRYLLIQEIRQQAGHQDVPHVSLYEAATGKLLRDWTADRASFVSTERLAVESGGAVRIYDLNTGRAIQALNGRFAAFSPDGQTTAVLVLGELRLLRVTDRVVLARMKSEIASVDEAQLAFAPDGQSLAAVLIDHSCCGGYNAQFTLYHVPDGRVILRASAGLQVFSPDGLNIVTKGAEGALQIHSTSDGTLRASLSGLTATVTALTFLGDEQQLVVSTYGDPTMLLFYQAESGELLHKIPTNINGYDYGLAASPDGRLLSLAGEVWETASGVRLDGLNRKIVEHSHLAANSLAFSPDGARLARGILGGRFELWDIPGQRLVMEQAACGEYDLVSSLAFSPDGQRLALACTSVMGSSGDSVQIWQAASLGRRLTELKGGPGGFSYVAYSRDGSLIAAAGSEARVWQAADGVVLFSLPSEDLPSGGTQSIALSPDGQVLALGYKGGSVALWGVVSGEKLVALPGSAGNPANALAFSPDGRLLAVGLADGTVRMWGIQEK